GRGGSPLDTGRHAGAPPRPARRARSVDSFRFLAPRTWRPPGRVFFFGATPARDDARRGVAVGTHPGEISGSEPPPAAPVIRQTGTRAARAFAAPGPRGAQHPSGASVRPAAALAARDRAKISTRRAARRRRRPRAS